MNKGLYSVKSNTTLMHQPGKNNAIESHYEWFYDVFIIREGCKVLMFNSVKIHPLKLLNKKSYKNKINNTK